MPPPPRGLLTPTGSLVPRVGRIAVLRANAMGDFVVALPALWALRAAYPQAEITYLGTAWHPTLLEGRPGPWDRVRVVPSCRGVSGDDGSIDDPPVQRFLHEQAAERYDLALQLHGGGGNSNPFVAGLGARVSAGARADGAPALDRWTPYLPDRHEVHRFLEVVGLVGAAPVEWAPRLEVTPDDRAAADDVLAPGPEPLVALHPGANDPRRRWPAECFATVARQLLEEGARIVLVGQGTADVQAAREIVAAVPTPVADLTGRLSPAGLVGVLERCRVVVGNDSGPRQLAAAVGTATVGVYWHPNLITHGPLTRRRHRVGVSWRTTCPRCGADQAGRRCPHDPSFVADVPVEEITAAALDLLADPEQSPPSGRLP